MFPKIEYSILLSRKNDFYNVAKKETFKYFKNK